MDPGVASFSPSQRRGALGALIRCWRSPGSGSDWGQRETTRVFQYVRCLSCNQTPAGASPGGARLVRTLPETEHSGRLGPGSHSGGCSRPGCGERQACWFRGGFFWRPQPCDRGGEVAGNTPTSRAHPSSSDVRCGNMRRNEGRRDSQHGAGWPLASIRERMQLCKQSEPEEKRELLFLFHFTLLARDPNLLYGSSGQSFSALACESLCQATLHPKRLHPFRGEQLSRLARTSFC